MWGNSSEWQIVFKPLLSRVNGKFLWAGAQARTPLSSSFCTFTIVFVGKVIAVPQRASIMEGIKTPGDCVMLAERDEIEFGASGCSFTKLATV